MLLVGAVGGGWALYAKLSHNITADDAAEAELARYERERPTALVRGAQNILLIGSDTRAGAGNRRYGKDSGTERSDTTILLHLARDRRSATAVSLPRDLMVHVPGCLRGDGRRSEPSFTLFNSAFEVGVRPAPSVPSRSSRTSGSITTSSSTSAGSRTWSTRSTECRCA